MVGMVAGDKKFCYLSLTISNLLKKKSNINLVIEKEQ